MTLNSTIETLFKDFKVNSTSIPVSFMKYTGTSTTYVIYMEISNDPKVEADNVCEVTAHEIDFDVYSKGNYIAVMKAVKELLVNNGFTWVTDSPDMYETETGYFHKTMTFIIED